MESTDTLLTFIYLPLCADFMTDRHVPTPENLSPTSLVVVPLRPAFYAP
jgi:hypothetical protein